MIRSTVKVFQQFPTITARVEQASKDGLDAAAMEAAAVAQTRASIDLELEVIPAHGDVDGYSSGIKARRQSSVEGKTTPIAWFFDRGTLGNRTRPLKRPRKESWTRAGHTAHRRDVTGKGIKPERFFGPARAAGRRKLIEKLAKL